MLVPVHHSLRVNCCHPGDSASLVERRDRFSNIHGTWSTAKRIRVVLAYHNSESAVAAIFRAE